MATTPVSAPNYFDRTASPQTWDEYQTRQGKPIQQGDVQTDERGLQYFNMSDGTKQFFMPSYAGTTPLEQLQAQRADPNYHKASLLKGQSKWDDATGTYKQGVNWNNLALMGAGGLIAAPAIAGAMGAAAGGGGAGAAGGGGGVAGGGLGSGALASGATIPGAGAVSGAGMGGGSSLLGTLSTANRIYQGANQAGDMLTQGAGAQAQGRRADSLADANAAQQNNMARSNIARFNLDAPALRASQVARGDVLNTMQNTPLTGDPRIDKFAGGGLRPSAFGPDSRAAGSELKKQALLALMNKSDQITPQLTTPKSAGKGENIMAGLGMAANLYGQYGKYI